MSAHGNRLCKKTSAPNPAKFHSLRQGYKWRRLELTVVVIANATVNATLHIPENIDQTRQPGRGWFTIGNRGVDLLAIGFTPAVTV